jgi:simple sugar transport system ATP-binding protein
VIAGQRRARTGSVLLMGEDVSALTTRGREQRGLRYVTDDRLDEGTVGDLDVAMNAVLKRIGMAPFWRAGAERRDEIDRFARELVERFDVRTPDVRTRVATLSGGNVQKLLLARELAGEPRVVVFNKPTHGLDVRTAEFVREQIAEAAAAGLAALLISTEIEELVDLCDRIVVMSRGEISGAVENSAGVEERIGSLMVARAGSEE